MMEPRHAPYSLMLVGLCALAGCSPGETTAPGSDDASVDSLIAQFGRTPLVMMAEEHRSRRVHDFLADLIADSRFGDAVDDIVVEFGSAYYQPLLDRYVAGEDVPHDSLQQVWRGTTQWLVWDSPLYEQFFRAVRARNSGQPPEKRVRVVLGDPPIHWPHIHSAEEYRRYAERDSFFAEVVEEQVLARGHRALLVIGGTHVYRRGPVDPSVPRMRPGAGELLAARHPRDLFVVWTLPPAPDAATTLGLHGKRDFLRLDGSPLEGESFARIAPQGLSVRRIVGGDTVWVPMGEVQWPAMSNVVDALLYLGSDATTIDPDPGIYADVAYQDELRRRAVILGAVYGFDFLPELDELLSDRNE